MNHMTKAMKKAHAPAVMPLVRKRKFSLETCTLFALAVMFVLPSFGVNDYDINGKYDTRIICEYDDGTDETLDVLDTLPQHKVGDVYKAHGLTLRTISINEYWHDGLAYDIRYFIVKVYAVHD